MCSDGSKNSQIPLIMEGETIFHGDGSFPSILNALDLFNPQGGVKHILDEKRQFFFEGIADLVRQGFILFFEPFAEPVSFYSSNHFRPSSTVLNTGD